MSGRQSPKVPRASLSVTMLDDDDYAVLMTTAQGRAAFAAFCALLMAARVQRNGGAFLAPISAIAGMCRWPARPFVKALDVLDAVCKQNRNGAWVVRCGDKLVIRNYAKWNELSKNWGGLRTTTRGQDGGQDGTQLGGQDGGQDDPQDGGASVSVSGTVRTPTERKSSEARIAQVGDNGARNATRERTLRHWRAINRIIDEQDSGVSPARRSEVIAAVNLIGRFQDSLGKVTEVVERSKKRHVDPLKRGGYVAEALIKAANELETKAAAQEARAPP